MTMEMEQAVWPSQISAESLYHITMKQSHFDNASSLPDWPTATCICSTVVLFGHNAGWVLMD